MYYEINIARNRKHFFATDKRSITDRKKLMEVLFVLMEKFPEEEGYSFSVTCREDIGKHVDIKELIIE